MYYHFPECPNILDCSITKICTCINKIINIIFCAAGNTFSSSWHKIFSMLLLSTLCLKDIRPSSILYNGSMTFNKPQFKKKDRQHKNQNTLNITSINPSTRKWELNLGFRIGKIFNEIKSIDNVLSVSHH